MADNSQPLNENTQSLDKATETLHELQQTLQQELGSHAQTVPPLLATPPPPSSSLGNVEVLFRKFQQEQQRQPTPAAPMAMRLSPEQAARLAQQNNPPPVPPHVAMLNSAVGASMQRMQELADFYRQTGASPQSLAAKGLRGAAKVQDDFIGKQFAGLSPEEQKQAMPQMQAMESKRQEVLETEMRLREQMNKELTRGRTALGDFVSSLTRGGPLGMLQSMNPATAAGATLAYLMHQQHQREVAGAREVPGVGSTLDIAKRREALEEALRSGSDVAMTEESRRKYARARLIESKQLREGEDPENVTGFKAMPMAAQSLWNRLRAAAANPGHPITAMEEAGARTHREYYEKLAQERGVKLQYPKNVELPPEFRPEGGITSALQYQSELQVNSLQRDDMTNDLLRRLIDLMGKQGGLLEGIKGNTNGLEGGPGWAG